LSTRRELPCVIARLKPGKTLVDQVGQKTVHGFPFILAIE
jgi:hypothetical protein